MTEAALETHVNARLTDNLTGGQIQEVLDALIHNAVSPIVRESNSFDLQVGYVLSQTSRNKKRKLSSLPREASIDTMCQFLVADDKDTKVKLISAMRLERGFIYNFVVKFLKETGCYLDLYREWLSSTSRKTKHQHSVRLSALEKSVGCSRGSLFQCIQTANDYLELAYTFRNTVVMNYLRHAFKQAKSFTKMKGPNFDFNDVYQNFLAAVTKAVDKYDASKGALTSYINFWLLNAQTTSNSTHGHEYGIAYTIPQLQKKALAEKSSKAKSVNFGVSLQKLVGDADDKKELVQYIAGDASVEQDMLDAEQIDTIRALVKHADPKGIARLYLDIDEVFSKKEKKKMLRTMRKQLNLVPVREGNTVKFIEKRCVKNKKPRNTVKTTSDTNTTPLATGD